MFRHETRTTRATFPFLLVFFLLAKRSNPLIFSRTARAPTRFLQRDSARCSAFFLFSVISLHSIFSGTTSALNFSLRWPQSLLASLASALDFSSCNRVGVESFTFFSRRRWILRNIFTCTSSAPTRFFTSRQRKVYCILCFSFILFANFQMETS